MSAVQWSRRDVLRVGLAGASAAALAACSPRSSSRNQEFVKEEIPYGDAELQVAELTIPRFSSPRPVAILIHGGYWRVGFTREAMADLADDLARIGYASWNLDYRRVGDEGGGWPGTVEDVASGIDALAPLAREKNLDLNRAVVIGHSAGAQLACWAAGRTRLPLGAPGAGGKVQLRGVVGLSGVYDLVGAATADGAGPVGELREAVIGFLGGTPSAVPDRYAQQSPLSRLPVGLPQLLLHGTGDDRVPMEQTRRYVAAAQRAGDKTTLVEVDEANHFDVVKASKAPWRDVLAWLTATIGDPLA